MMITRSQMRSTTSIRCDGKDYDLSERGKGAEDLLEDQDGRDVKPGEGLIEQEHVGVMQYGREHEDFLAHALGIILHGQVALHGQADLFH